MPCDAGLSVVWLCPTCNKRPAVTRFSFCSAAVRQQRIVNAPPFGTGQVRVCLACLVCLTLPGTPICMYIQVVEGVVTFSSSTFGIPTIGALCPARTNRTRICSLPVCPVPCSTAHPQAAGLDTFPGSYQPGTNQTTGPNHTRRTGLHHPFTPARGLQSGSRLGYRGIQRLPATAATDLFKTATSIRSAKIRPSHSIARRNRPDGSS